MSRKKKGAQDFIPDDPTKFNNDADFISFDELGDLDDNRGVGGSGSNLHQRQNKVDTPSKKNKKSPNKSIPSAPPPPTNNKIKAPFVDPASEFVDNHDFIGFDDMEDGGLDGGSGSRRGKGGNGVGSGSGSAAGPSALPMISHSGAFRRVVEEQRERGTSNRDGHSDRGSPTSQRQHRRFDEPPSSARSRPNNNNSYPSGGRDERRDDGNGRERNRGDDRNAREETHHQRIARQRDNYRRSLSPPARRDMNGRDRLESGYERAAEGDRGSRREWDYGGRRDPPRGGGRGEGSRRQENISLDTEDFDPRDFGGPSYGDRTYDNIPTIPARVDTSAQHQQRGAGSASASTSHASSSKGQDLAARLGVPFTRQPASTDRNNGIYDRDGARIGFEPLQIRPNAPIGQAQTQHQATSSRAIATSAPVMSKNATKKAKRLAREEEEARRAQAGPSRRGGPAPPQPNSAQKRKPLDAFDGSDSSDQEGPSKRPPTKKQKQKQQAMYDPRDGYAADKSGNRPRANAARTAASHQSGSAAPWFENVDPTRYNSAAELGNAEAWAVYDWIKPTHQEHLVRQKMLDIVTAVIHREFPSARVHSFGSHETGLYLPGGDLDIVIDENSPGLNVPIARWDRVPLSQYHILGMSSREIEAEKRKHDKANAVLRILREAILDSGVAESAEHVVGARVPVLKFLTSLGGIAVDISFNELTALTQITVIDSFLSYWPILRPLIMIVKAWMTQNSLHEVRYGGVGSYAIICMCISLLQNVREAEDLGLLDLLKRFFRHYSDTGPDGFPYTDSVIVIGSPEQKSFPRSGLYRKKSALGFRDHRKTHLLSIQDPCKPTNDITKGSTNISQVVRHFKLAHQTVDLAQKQRDPKFVRYQSSGFSEIPSDWLDRTGRLSPERLSVLPSILASRPAERAGRDRLHRLFESSDLDEMLQYLGGIETEPNYSIEMVVQVDMDVRGYGPDEETNGVGFEDEQHRSGRNDLSPDRLLSAVILQDGDDGYSPTGPSKFFALPSSDEDAAVSQRRDQGRGQSKRQKKTNSAPQTAQTSRAPSVEVIEYADTGAPDASALSGPSGQSRRAQYEAKQAYWLSKGAGPVKEQVDEKHVLHGSGAVNSANDSEGERLIVIEDSSDNEAGITGGL